VIDIIIIYKSQENIYYLKYSWPFFRSSNSNQQFYCFLL